MKSSFQCNSNNVSLLKYTQAGSLTINGKLLQFPLLRILSLGGDTAEDGADVVLGGRVLEGGGGGGQACGRIDPLTVGNDHSCKGRRDSADVKCGCCQSFPGVSAQVIYLCRRLPGGCRSSSTRAELQGWHLPPHTSPAKHNGKNKGMKQTRTPCKLQFPAAVIRGHDASLIHASWRHPCAYYIYLFSSRIRVPQWVGHRPKRRQNPSVTTCTLPLYRARALPGRKAIKTFAKIGCV